MSFLWAGEETATLEGLAHIERTRESQLHNEILCKLWNSYSARQGVWTCFGSKGFFEGAVGNDVIESAVR